MGIGDIVDPTTVNGWIAEYLGGRSDGKGLAIAFRFGVAVEPRNAGRSFIEAEPAIRSEWSAEARAIAVGNRSRCRLGRLRPARSRSM